MALLKIDMTNTEAYLKRIRIKTAPEVSVATLKVLHRQQVMMIPFENLDIALGRPINLAPNALFTKIIHDRRGGFCYELNSLFCWLLQKLGFRSHLISCSIMTEEGSFGPLFDHMAIIVKMEDLWLVDVGYGDLFIEPLLLTNTHAQQDQFKHYQLIKENEDYTLSESKDGMNFQPRYTFNTIPRRIADFEDQCHWKQYSPDSYFVKNRICTLPHPKGRTTLFNDKLIRRRDRKREETIIDHPAQYDLMLKRYFGIDGLG